MLKINYSSLNAKQKESYNYQKVSAVLADYGYTCYRMFDDYNGADFHAVHVDGHVLKVQLKGRFHVDKKYLGKDIRIAFPDEKGEWYLCPHDELHKIITNNTIGAQKNGGRSFRKITKKLLEYITKYKL